MAVSPHAMVWVFGIMLIAMVVVGVPTYIYAAIVFYRVLKKTGVSKPWAAWIPFYGMIKMLNAIGMRGWWILLPTVISLIGVGISPPGIGHSFTWVTILTGTLSGIILAVWYATLFRGFGMSPVYAYFYAGVGIPVLNLICIIVVFVGLSIIAFRKGVVWWGVR
ncbi:hypothetical protein IW967_09885 [Alicyclobacillus mali]|uniref:Uncharacterized protein n=1 Tax=Alicyclobacillus mali (ex Roth et al. 2021) TaxID=1123961 RepID=A0ABS0F4F8_9BACL|nr:hypothetical protein [Alicyclobacillus mali (ex Roth et al. 2021)]MBF8378168.1 hypothetical protein [Alicyclobacillus mali (ex Roth et al. 2021)]